MALTVEIEKRMGDFHLDARFETGNGVLSLLGASGCGKSVTLKCIAGIERPDRGRIILNGMTLFDSERHIDLPPQKRRVGYLFQQYALFPNMTVRQNIRCGVREREGADAVVDGIIRKMHLEGLEKLPNLREALEFLLTADNDEQGRILKSAVVEDVCASVVRELKGQRLTHGSWDYLEPHAYEIIEHIESKEV